MKTGAKEMKKAYKNVKIDQIEVKAPLTYQYATIYAVKFYVLTGEL